MLPTDPGWHRGDWMQTFTGKRFYPTNPRPEDVDPVDIAHSLSMLCRYAGHVDRFYSVAEHCVKIADWMLAQGLDIDVTTLALLHDATEAYCVDVPRPLKIQMPEYQAIEARVEEAIVVRFNLARMFGSVGDLHIARNAVKLADTRILLDERNALMSRTQHAWGVDGGKFEPLGVQIDGWSPARAEDEYLIRLQRLGVS
jgi:hypothetical protein